MSGYSQEQEKSYAVVAETRRKWSEAERRQIVAETEAASVSSVARKYRVAASLVFRWRRAAGMAGKSAGKPAPASAFVPVLLPAPSPGAGVSSPGAARGTIEIELAGGHKLRVSGPVDASALKQVIAVVEGR